MDSHQVEGVIGACNKGKEKVNQELLITEGNTLSEHATDFIENGKLVPISKEFGTLTFDLNKEIWHASYCVSTW